MANSVSLNAKSPPAETRAGSRVEAKPELTPTQRAKLQLNASIMQASASISIGAQDDPQALLYKSAITGINEALQAELGDNAVQNAASQDHSPEGTAGRILSFSTAFLGAYKKQNPGMEDSAAMEKFMDTIKGGIEKGFREARDILKGLNVLGGDIAGSIDRTYELVMKGLDDFAANAGGPEEEKAA
ncbi:DUF5610 domain-containing protein [Pseudoduganella plicata]|uniref:DUF5610 domain-containing protein n=1 Tax=Pseudoduganella plicata TaxID=321984 RepID=A0A4P7BJK1_9BURK|nr:DUF5610 domain-containing protein [Pseudoduganella plicata]QBQ38620.1 hypothetical protein E1742_22435 [Pseudoduganella plicata]GGY83658.1 hypothetical protein GCM10007388_15870 [Pseudoduganella plicata]